MVYPPPQDADEPAMLTGGNRWYVVVVAVGGARDACGAAVQRYRTLLDELAVLAETLEKTTTERNFGYPVSSPPVWARRVLTLVNEDSR